VQGSLSAEECSCSPGYTGSGRSSCAFCQTCTYKITPGDAVCTACENGKYSGTAAATESSVCQTCPSNSNAPASSTSNSDCKCNAGWSGVNGDTCAHCDEGKYKPDLAQICLNCPLNSQSPRNSVVDTACECNAGWAGANWSSMLIMSGRYLQTKSRAYLYELPCKRWVVSWQHGRY